MGGWGRVQRLGIIGWSGLSSMLGVVAMSTDMVAHRLWQGSGRYMGECVEGGESRFLVEMWSPRTRIRFNWQFALCQCCEATLVSLQPTAN